MRLAFKARRQAMSEEECKMRANALCKRIVESEAYQKAQSVMAYLAMPKEANLDALVTQVLADGKTVYVPVCVSKTEMVAARLRRLDDVKTGVLHIRIPNEPYECAAPTDLDLILVPGVAFDTKGAQVARERLWGVAWDIQVVPDTIPMEVHDKRLGGLITDERVLTFI